MLNDNAHISTRDHLDLAGIAISSVCVVHCIVTPIAVSLLPLFGSALASGWVHILFAALLVPLALIALFRGYQRHRRLRSLAIGSVGVAIVLAVVITRHLLYPADDCCRTISASPFEATHISASLMLVAAHLLNIRDGFHPCCPGNTP